MGGVYLPRWFRCGGARVLSTKYHTSWEAHVPTKVIGYLLYQMCVEPERKDLPGSSIQARVQKAWSEVRAYWAPHEAPIKEIKEQSLRPSTSHGLKGVSYKAKAKETWDAWPAIYAMVMRWNAVKLEQQMASQLNVIIEMMHFHHLTSLQKKAWRSAELNFLGLLEDLQFPVAPKFHQLQHIFLQLEYDCAPRYSYCFAEESKNAKLAELAKRAANAASLPERVLLMHELWAASGKPTIAKLRKRRLAQKASSKRSRTHAGNTHASPATDISLDSNSDVDVDLD